MSQKAQPIAPFANIEHRKTRDALQFTWSYLRRHLPPRPNRLTITADRTLLKTDSVISVDASSNTVDVTLDATPVDGQEYDIHVNDSTFTVTLVGVINGVTNPTFVKYGSPRVVWNADIDEWENR